MGPVRTGEIVVGADGRYSDGKITAYTDKEIVMQVDGAARRCTWIGRRWRAWSSPMIMEQQSLLRRSCPRHYAARRRPALGCARRACGAADEGGRRAELLCHSTARRGLARRLSPPRWRSRWPTRSLGATVVVLDVDSPGGSVDEALKIIKAIARLTRKSGSWCGPTRTSPPPQFFRFRQSRFSSSRLGQFAAATAICAG